MSGNTLEQVDFYTLIYHDQAKHFLKRLLNGQSDKIFLEALGMPPEEARTAAEKLVKSVNSYCNAIYKEEFDSGRFKKSLYYFTDNKNVIAVLLNYILNSLANTYPGDVEKIRQYMVVNILGPSSRDTSAADSLEITPVKELISNTVQEFMIQKDAVITIAEESSIRDFYNCFVTYGFHGYPVVNEYDDVVGYVSFWHIKKEQVNEMEPVKNHMYRIQTADPLKISKRASLEDAYRKILTNHFSRLFVYNNSHFIGLIAKSVITRIINTK